MRMDGKERKKAKKTENSRKYGVWATGKRDLRHEAGNEKKKRKNADGHRFEKEIGTRKAECQRVA